MSELVEARENLTKKDGEIESLRQSKTEIETRLSSLAAVPAAAAAEPKVVEVIKEVRADSCCAEKGVTLTLQTPLHYGVKPTRSTLDYALVRSNSYSHMRSYS